ncbi:MAG: acyl carrier protein [Verrucomicrobia bacterium]|nr:acyl carrier protein [Verrucomicrobiota bacterium]
MQEKVQTILVDVLHIPALQVRDSLAMKEVETWDSMRHMELVASIEQTFGIELTMDEIVSMISVGDIKRVLRGRGLEG